MASCAQTFRDCSGAITQEHSHQTTDGHPVVETGGIEGGRKGV